MIRRTVFGKTTSGLNGTLTAEAGPNQSVDIDVVIALSSTGSVSSLGTITSYLWEIVQGTGLFIENPTSATSNVSGTGTIGDHIIKLTVTDDLGNTSSDTTTITINDPFASDMTFFLSVSELSITGGQPNEIVELIFSIYSGSFGDSASFLGINLGTFNYENNYIVKNVTLNTSGELLSTPSFVGSGFLVEVRMNSRSSSGPIPSPDRYTVFAPS